MSDDDLKLVQQLREQATNQAASNEGDAFERLEWKAADAIEDMQHYVRQCTSQCNEALRSLLEHKNRLELLEKQVFDISYMLTSESLRSKKLEAELRLIVEKLYAVSGFDWERVRRALEEKP